MTRVKEAGVYLVLFSYVLVPPSGFTVKSEGKATWETAVTFCWLDNEGAATTIYVGTRARMKKPSGLNTSVRRS